MLLRSFYLAVFVVYLCAASSPEPEEDSTPHTKFRDKRTLNFILHGLASLLGYRLERQEDASNTVTTTAAPVVLLPITNTKPPQHHTEKYPYPQNYNIFKVGAGHGNSHTASYDVPKDCNHGNVHHNLDYNAHNRNNHFSNNHHHVDGIKGQINSDRSDHIKSNRQKVDDYLERVGHYIKNRLKEGNSGKIQDKESHGREKDVHSKSGNKSYEHFKEPSDEDWESDHSWPYDSDESGEEKAKGKHKKTEQEGSKKEKVQQKLSPETKAPQNGQGQKSETKSHKKEGTIEKNLGVKEGHVQNGGSPHQIPPPPPPPLQNWEEDFWSDHYTFTPNSAYSFNVPDFNADGSSSEEHKSSDYTFGGNQQNSHLPEDSYSRARYTVDAVDDYIPIHSWHVTSDGSTDKSIIINREKQASDQQEQQEITPTTTEAFESSNFESSESLTTTSSKDVPDNPPMPILSTVKPKLAQLIHEVEGTKQNPLWPPPFDHAFESTDSSVVVQHPENTENVKNPSGPLLLNLYNYTSISDYLLDLSAKNVKQKEQIQKQKNTSSQPKNINSSTNQKQQIQQPELSYLAVVVPHETNDKLAQSSEKPEEPQPSYYGILYPRTPSTANHNSHDSTEYHAQPVKKEDENEIKYNSPTGYKRSHIKEQETRNGYNIQHSEQVQQSLPLSHAEETKNEHGNQQPDQRQQYGDLGFYYNPHHYNSQK